MHRSDRRAWRVVLALWMGGACGSDDDDMTVGSAESTAATTSSGTSSDTTTEGQEATTGSGDTTGAPALSCEEAFDATMCAQANDRDEGCGWFEVMTVALDADGMCGPVQHDAGYCVLTSRGDDGCGVFGDPSCPDGQTTIYYNPIGLEIGAVELFVDADMTCDGPRSPFMPCVYDGATWDPPECECGCP